MKVITRISNRQASQALATMTWLAAAVLLQARGQHEIGQLVALTVVVVWGFYLATRRMQSAQTKAQASAAAVAADQATLTAHHGGIGLRRRPVLITHPMEVPCARGCGHMGTPQELGYDPYLGHVCKSGCLTEVKAS